MRFGEIRYFHCHYFVRLVEGLPPKDYYGTNKTGNEKLKEYIDNLRARRIEFGL
jgi:large subunit ribosomal protein L22